MITARQSAWEGGGDRGFNKHASYGPLVAFNFSMQICTGLNFESDAFSWSLTCVEAVPAVEGTATCTEENIIPARL